MPPRINTGIICCALEMVFLIIPNVNRIHSVDLLFICLFINVEYQYHHQIIKIREKKWLVKKCLRHWIIWRNFTAVFSLAENRFVWKHHCCKLCYARENFPHNQHTHTQYCMCASFGFLFASKLNYVCVTIRTATETLPTKW